MIRLVFELTLASQINTDAGLDLSFSIVSVQSASVERAAADEPREFTLFELEGPLLDVVFAQGDFVGSSLFVGDSPCHWLRRSSTTGCCIIGRKVDLALEQLSGPFMTPLKRMDASRRPRGKPLDKVRRQSPLRVLNSRELIRELTGRSASKN